MQNIMFNRGVSVAFLEVQALKSKSSHESLQLFTVVGL